VGVIGNIATGTTNFVCHWNNMDI